MLIENEPYTIITENDVIVVLWYTCSYFWSYFDRPYRSMIRS
jgi:hypothetical protein